MTIGQRLDHFKKTANHSNLSLSKVIDVDNSTVGKIISGKNNLTNEMLLALYSKLGLNINWLLTGEGKMMVPENEKSGDIVPDYIKEIFIQEINNVRSSLEKLEKAVLSPSAVQISTDHRHQQAALGKKRGQVRGKKESRLKDNS